ncbi:microsomal triacylglycerol transfer protein [Lutzomyia longipalpis]|uniref:microsomal triacylglycerol transfer protein n=1 Tax=Lutzomyia longipalpis TaxID=7200 RepID=UPI002483A599|nr:microsomal triacylglycerol transfer protein [Lutzomyia longipalpis]
MHTLVAVAALLLLFLGQSSGKIFPLGVQYEYTVSNVVVINDLHAGASNSSMELSTSVKVKKIWDAEGRKILAFTLNAPTLHADGKELFTLPKSVDEGFLLEFAEEGTNIYLLESDTVSMRNLKRGIASVFQFFPESGSKTEIDIAGECSISYDEISDRIFVKRKIKCATNHKNIHQRKETPLGIITPNARNTEYTLDVGGSIEKIENVEFFRISLAGNRDIGATVDSRLSLKLNAQKDDEESKKISSFDGVFADYKNFKKFEIFHEQEEKSKENDKMENVIQLIKKFKKDLSGKNIGTEKLSYTTVKLVEVFRESTVEDLVRILDAQSMKNIKGQLVDILGATQTITSHNAVKKALDFFKAENFPYVERYLQSLAVGSRPKSEVIEDLLEVLKRDTHENVKLTQTLVQTISSMANNFVALSVENSKTQIFQNVLNYFRGIIEKTSKTERKIIFLRGFINFKSQETIPFLLDFVLKGTKSVSTVSMKALVAMPREYFSMEHVYQFENIYHQKIKKFDSSIRTMAAEILLDPLFYTTSIRDMINALKLPGDSYEVKQYFMQRLRMECEMSKEFRAYVYGIIQQDPTLNNYNIFATRGLSTALSRQFLAAPSFNSSLVSVQEIDQGILKRGIVDMLLETETSKFSYFTIGLFADGLTSFLGSSDSDKEDPQEEATETTAGMELIVQGNYLRPLEFFRGQGELMGHVWSGTASELTPAYQATTLLHDHNDAIWLQNGLSVTIDLLGAMSINLNGQVTISIWYRSAKSRVLQEIGLAVYGRVSVINDYVKMANEFVMQQEPKLDLVSDIDFSGNPILCMQLSQPNSEVKLTHTKTLDIEGLQKKFKNEARTKYKIPGYTHVLNRKNNEICNQIHS